MHLPFTPSFAVFVATALAFGFLNGFQDSANSVATMIASRAMSPRRALFLNAISNFIGPFLFGSAIARTIGRDIVARPAATQPVVLAALVGAMGWNLFTWLLGLPSSSSHALIGGIVGAAITGHGLEAVLVPGVVKVLLSLLMSPVIGMVAGYLLTRLTFFLARGVTPRINFFFRRAQTLTATALALSSGTNAVQKTMGIITMGLVAEGFLTTFVVPTWVIIACATAMALGIGLGGYRIIRTLGARFYRVRPVHSFTSQAASAGVILGAALLGGPVSTTQVVSTSILGAGSAERVNKIRWGVAGDIVVAWLLTIPASASAAALVYVLVRGFGF